mmetsp:Transcript_31336/g.97500  ORF Transcript_31336/g.97500 Transcript_31336/m.97500 type:complete len:210 (-) Transcript_31336:93-722(-)
MSLFCTRRGSSACSFSAFWWFSTSCCSSACVVSSVRAISVFKFCSISCRSRMDCGVPFCLSPSVSPLARRGSSRGDLICADSHWLMPTWACDFCTSWFCAFWARSMSRRLISTLSSKFCISSCFHVAPSAEDSSMSSSGKSDAPPPRSPGGLSGACASLVFSSAISPLRSLMISVYFETWQVSLTTFRIAFVLIFFARFAYFSVLCVSS